MENPLDVNLKSKNEAEIADTLMDRGQNIIYAVRRFKQPRLDQIQKYRNLYAGNVPKKYRQTFNVVLPVFSGAMDTLMASFNDEISVKYEEQEPADYISVKKLNALWKQETESTSANAKFPVKTRQDRSNALYSGRGFMRYYAESDPKYKSCFEIAELEDVIFQPQGGGHLENHLFSGLENIIRTESQLLNGPYNQTQVGKLLAVSARDDFFPPAEVKSTLSKFEARGLNPSDANYVGERVFNLTELTLEVKGKRWYLLYSPWYKVWVRSSPLSELDSTELFPLVSWATHDDNKNFLSKSYADDLYGIADATHTLFNQELTNREKKNFNARAYDPRVFQNVAKLDEAQYRPDALVPASPVSGQRISDGIFEFKTAELSGTINLLDWMNNKTDTDVGVTELSKGGVQQASKRASVVFSEQQNISKRFLLRSSPYSEAMGEIGKRFISGAKEHLPATKAIKILGAEGQGWDEIKKIDLDTYSDIDVKIVSSSQQIKDSVMKKEARMNTLVSIGNDPLESPLVNVHARVEEKLRSGGEFSDSEIAILMDTKNYGNKTEASYAHRAIQDILAGETPEVYYAATGLLMEIVYDFANTYKKSIGNKKFIILMDYIQAHAQISQDNMARKAKADIRQQQMNPSATPGATPNTSATIPAPATNIINKATPNQ
jgi:hypothetical protein